MAGDQQVALTWNASSGATSYHVKRGTERRPVHAGGRADRSQLHRYRRDRQHDVLLRGDGGELGGRERKFQRGSATPIAPLPGGGTSSSVHVTVDVLANRHAISPYVYGVNFPSNTAYVTDSGATFVRWGGNASTRYNWLNFATNAATDWYFQNRAMGNGTLDTDSTTVRVEHCGSGCGADHDDRHAALGGERRQCD